MLLAIDIGNSQTSFGVFEKAIFEKSEKPKLTHHWRGETHPTRTADEYAAFLFPLLAYAGLKATELEGVAVCSVVPPCEPSLENFCQQYLKKTPFKVTAQSSRGFTINVEVPNEVGADRLANAAYAVKHMKLPAIVVDLGTATTFDVISEKRVYEGGIILPGIRMGAESLSRKTSLLPLINVDFPATVIGKSTVSCIQSGILYGYCDAIDGLLTRLLQEIGKPCDIALTGGLSGLVGPKLKTPARILPDLTLEGVEILYRQR